MMRLYREWQGTYILPEKQVELPRFNFRFCVSPVFQNQGIGKTVLHHVEEQIKAMGYQSVRLDTFTENPFAQRLYLHNGYESRGYASWRKGKFDLMEKKL